MIVKLRLTDFIILITLASTLLNIVFNNVPSIIGSFRFIWAPITILTIGVTRFKVFTKNPLNMVLLYGLLFTGILHYILWTYMNDWNRSRILDEFYYLAISTTIWSYYFVKGEFKRLALITKWVFIFIVITIIMTHVALSIDPLIVRYSAAGFLGDPVQMRLFKLTGSGGAGFAQATLLLIPILVYHIKNTKKMVFSPKILISILILILILALRAQVFGSLLVAIFITILSIMGTKKRKKNLLFILLFTTILLTISGSFYSKIFTTLGSIFEEGQEISNKFYDFARFFEDPELDSTTGAGSRAERYPLLFKALISNPLLGYTSQQSSLNISLGAHLYWMNLLALWGIPGFLFWILLLRRIYKTILSTFINAEIRYYFFLTLIAFIMIGLTKRISGREPWLFMIVVIPGLFFSPLIEKNKS